MFQKLPPLKTLIAFESAARYCSFSDAAKELSLTQGAISYQVKQLEQSLGIKLFHRSVRQVVLTTEGKRLYQTTQQLLQTLKDEIQLIAPNSDTNQQVLTISVSTFFATRWLSKRLGDFLNTHPQITIRLQHSVNDPEFMVDDVDMGIRWGNGDFVGCDSQKILSMPMKAYCSPNLLKGKNAIKQFTDLKNQTFLRDQIGLDAWQEWLSQAGLGDISIDNNTVIVDPNVRIQSAIDGHGILLANPMLFEEIERGELVELFSDIYLDGLGYYIINKKQDYHSQSFKLFRYWLLKQADS